MVLTFYCCLYKYWSIHPRRIEKFDYFPISFYLLYILITASPPLSLLSPSASPLHPPLHPLPSTPPSTPSPFLLRRGETLSGYQSALAYQIVVKLDKCTEVGHGSPVK